MCEDMTNIESLDIKASSAVSHIFRTLLNAVFSGDEEDDALSFQDKELLEDVLRYGTIAELARRSGKGYRTLCYQVETALDRLTVKAKALEIRANRIIQAREEESQSQLLITSYKQTIKKQKEAVKEAKAETAQMESRLKAYLEAHPQLEELINLKPQYSILEQKLAVAQDELESARNKIAEYEEELDSLRKIEKAYNEFVDYKPKYEEAKQTIVQLRKEISQLKSSKKNLITRNQKLQSELTQYKGNNQKGSARDSARYTKLKKRNESLENLLKEYKKRGLPVLLESDLID